MTLMYPPPTPTKWEEDCALPLPPAALLLSYAKVCLYYFDETTKKGDNGVEHSS